MSLSDLKQDNDIDASGQNEQPQRLGVSTSAGWILWISVGIVFAIGLALRLWYLTHQPTNSDVATVGLMAQEILNGHFSAFYWGQSYGGAEPYVVAAMFGAFGQSTIVLNLTSVLLDLVAVVIFWRILLRLKVGPTLALVLSAFVWIFPQVDLWNSTFEFGFRGVLAVCGLTSILVTLRMLDGLYSLREFGALGLVVGIGWWASPEILYYLIPAALIFVGSVVVAARTQKTASYWLYRGCLGVVAFVFGSLPWIWANVSSGFASLKAGSFEVPPGSPGYGGRLRDFFQFSFPMQLNLREPQTGVWWHGSTFTGAVAVLFGLVLLTLILLTARKGGRWLAVAIGAAVFPFAVALLPATWFWGDGRYVVSFSFLLTLAIAPAIHDLGLTCSRFVKMRSGGRRRTRHIEGWLAVGAGVIVLAAATTMTLHNFSGFYHFIDPEASFTSDWGSPDAPASQNASQLETLGIHDAYADYWVAYKLDLLGGGAIHVTVIPPDPDRWPAENRVVADSSKPAWLFVALNPSTIQQFANQEIVGPEGLTQQSFQQALEALGVKYRVVSAGPISAVIPNRNVTPSQVRGVLAGIPAA